MAKKKKTFTKEEDKKREVNVDPMLPVKTEDKRGKVKKLHELKLLFQSVKRDKALAIEQYDAKLNEIIQQITNYS